MLLKPDDSREGYDRITMGITPSGNADLHLGHQSTLFELARLLESTETAQAFLWIDDREFHTQAPPQIPSRCLVQKLEQQVETFLTAAESHFKCELLKRVTRKRMSDFFLEESGLKERFCGQELIRLLLDRGSVFGQHYPHMQLSGKRAIRPINTSLGAGPLSPKEKAMGDNFVVHPHYINANTKDYGHIGIDTSRENNWALFYCYCFLRDLVIAERDDTNFLHLYGGDYAMPWGRGLISKVERNNAIGSVLSKRVDFTTGKLIMKDGQKLSKSGGAERAELDFATLERISAVDGDVVDISYL